MRNEANAADSGALSVDQAVARLTEGQRKKKNAAPADTISPDDEEAATNGKAPARERAQGEESGEEADETLRQAHDEDDDYGAEDDESEDAALEPPKFWDAEAKKRFADSPRDLQEIVLGKENERNQATAKALQESAERRKAAEAEAARFKSSTDGFDTLLPHALAAFDHRWSHVNWASVARQHGAEAALKLQQQMQAERLGLQQLSAAREKAELLSHRRFVQEQENLMPEHAPELADKKDGPARRQELSRFLASLGAAPDQLRKLSALEAGLAYDAMQWRNAKAKADSLIKAPRENLPPKRTPAKPGGTSQRGTTQQNRIAHLANKKELSVDEAVELHNLKGLQ
jgi:hypothetical protein